MKYNYLYIFLFLFLFSCKNEIKQIDAYDGIQTLEFDLNVEPYQVLEGMSSRDPMSPNIYKIFLFKDNLYSGTMVLEDEKSVEYLEGGYSYLAVGAEDENMIPEVTLVEGTSGVDALFLDLSDEENIIKDVPDIVVSSGNFTMGSTINTVKIDFHPLGCEYSFNCKGTSLHTYKKMKLVLEGGASSYSCDLKSTNDKLVETIMKSENITEDGWIDINKDEILCTAKVLISRDPSLKLSLLLMDENGQIKEIDDINIDLFMEGGSYMADLTLSDNSDNVELEYYSPFYPKVSVTKTDNLNENELKLISRVYSDYKYQWRHERMGRTVLSGISNGVFKYNENGIPEGAIVTVNGAGKYILSIEKNGVVKDIASTIIKHESMSWNEAVSKTSSGEWILPNRNQMLELYNNGINDFYYDEDTDKYTTECYWTSDESGTDWAYVYFFNPFWINAPTWDPLKTTIHATRFLKSLPFEHDPEDPFSVGIMPSPQPYSGELKLYITTPTYDGAIYQWYNEKTGRNQLCVDGDGNIKYKENGIPEGPEVYVTGAGKYILNVTYGGETKSVGSIVVEHEKLSWNDVQNRLSELNSEGDNWKVPSKEQLIQMYNQGNNDCQSGWYWSNDFTNAANRWKFLKDMGNGNEDGGDITDETKKYYVRFIKQSN